MNTNRLINEKSPYLLQHAHNPVDWYPWGKEALEKAEKENKPVFLSIGYSTCHWCHVMEKESFEDKEVAEMLNKSFVAIKVDREERPDIDGIYMTVCQMLTGSGGWPLTIFMTPDKKPFFAGTYFPKENRFGRSGIIDILFRIDHIWNTRKEEVLKSANEITGALLSTSKHHGEKEVTPDISDKVYADLARRFDSLHGGFGNAPKFPTPHNLLFLLRYWKRTKEDDALRMVEKTLTEMRKGGIYDHLGGGFHRYSTDRRWLVPHFEKMLYDQALIAPVYLETYQATGNSFYKETAEEIFTYILRDMTSPEGGFYSAEDADSEGVEGKFYLWTETEIKNILKDDADKFLKIFNTNNDGNWVDPMIGSKDGTNIIHLQENMETLSDEYKLNSESFRNLINGMSAKLFREREKRVHPYKDDKILTDWNSLMISALIKGFSVTVNKEYIAAAEKCINFIWNKLYSENKLLHRYREGEAGLPAHLDDYVFFISALIDFYEIKFNSAYLQKAVVLTRHMINEFWDHDSGGFYFTSNDNKDLISRQKDLYDGAIPSGNSVAVLNLLRLSRLTNNIEFERKAMQTASIYSAIMESAPAGYTYAASAFEFAFSGSYEIIIAAEKLDSSFYKILETLHNQYIPNKVIIYVPPEDEVLFEISPSLKNYGMKDGRTTIYICRNYQCSLPVHKAEEMLELLT